MSLSSQRVTEWRRNTKQKLIEALGGKCAICGYTKCAKALEFHHLDPSIKETHWGAINGSIRSWAYIVKEMEKCVCLCSNCHKEVHAGVASVPENVQRLDENLIKSNKIRTRKEISKKPRRNRYEGVDLQALYEENGRNYCAVGSLFGVTGAAIKRKMTYANKSIPIGQDGNVSGC